MLTFLGDTAHFNGLSQENLGNLFSILGHHTVWAQIMRLKSNNLEVL